MCLSPSTKHPEITGPAGLQGLGPSSASTVGSPGRFLSLQVESEWKLCLAEIQGGLETECKVLGIPGGHNK